LEDLSLN